MGTFDNMVFSDNSVLTAAQLGIARAFNNNPNVRISITGDNEIRIVNNDLGLAYTLTLSKEDM